MNRLSQIILSGIRGLDPASQSELRAIGADSDPSLERSDLLKLGRRWRLEGRDEIAAQLFATLEQSDRPEESTGTAHKELSAMLGHGNFGRRFEYLASRFAQDFTDYRQLVPMLAAGIAGEWIGAATLARLSGAARPALATRSLAAAASLLVETPVLLETRRILTDDPKSVSATQWAGTAISLGAMKAFGGIGRKLLEPLPSALIPARPALFQATLFTGLLVGHHAEESLGLRERKPDATILSDTLFAWLGLRIGAGIGQKLGSFTPEPWRMEMLRQGAHRLARRFSEASLAYGALSCFTSDAKAASGNHSTSSAALLLGAGALALGSMGIYGFLRWTRRAPIRPGDFYFEPTPRERVLLKDFYLFGKVPERLTWQNWQRIQRKVLRAAKMLPVGANKSGFVTFKQIELRDLAVRVYSAKEKHYLTMNAPIRRSYPSVFTVQPDPFPSSSGNAIAP